MLHITQCIVDELFVKVLIGYFAGGPKEKFYRIFTAKMKIVADDNLEF